MKITGESGLGDILKKFLQICFWVGIVAVIFLPFLLQNVGLNLISSCLIIYPNGIVLLIITRRFIQLFDSLKNNNPFCYENVKLLKMTGIVAFLGAVLWLIDLLGEIILVKSEDIVFLFTLGFLCILFLGVSIALYMLSELLKEATEYKKENDLTI